MQLTTLSIFPIFKVWNKITRKAFSRSGFVTTLWHTFGILSIISYQMGFVTIFTRCVVVSNLGEASAVAVLMELVRFLMKSYAFIRTNVPRTLNSRHKFKIDDSEWDSTEEITSDKGTAKINNKKLIPSFSNFVYFLFAPTLVYRDEYPRTKQIRWKFVGKNFMEVIAVIFIYR